MMKIEDFMKVLDNTDIRINLYEDIDDDCIWTGTANELASTDRFDDWTVTLINISSIDCGEVVSLEVVE